MKKIIDFLSDRKLLIGIGIGIIIATVFMSTSKISYQMSDYEVEKRAIKMGMVHKDNVKVINDRSGSK